MWILALLCHTCLATHLRGVRPALQSHGLSDPEDVFHDAKGRGPPSDIINKTLHEHMDFQSVRDPGDTDAVVVEQTFDSLDTNYDDSLSRAEFIAGALRNNPGSRDKLVEIFSSIDTNADGEISRTEFVSAAKGSQKMGGLNPAFRLADADGDGFLSQDEFFFIARQFYPLEWQNSDALIPLFHLLDTDVDGRLSRMEFLKQADGGPVLTRHHARLKPIPTKPVDDRGNRSERLPVAEPGKRAKVAQTSKRGVFEKTEKVFDEKGKTEKTRIQGKGDFDAIPDWLRPDGLSEEVAHDIAQETAKAVREVIRQELGTSPLSPAAKAAMDAAKSAGLSKEGAAAAAAEAAGRAAADEASTRDASPKKLGAVAATAAFRAALATGMTKTQAAMRSAETASKAAADKALALSSNFQQAAQVAANVAFQAALDAGMSYSQAAQAAAEAAGRVIASHPSGIEQDITAAAKAAQQGVQDLGAPKEVAVVAATAAVGSAAAEEALAEGKRPKEAAGAAANAVFSFSVTHGLKAEEAVSQSTVAAAEAALQVAIASGKGTQEVVDTAVETAEETLTNLGNSTPTKKVDNAVEATREMAISNPKLSNLTLKQKLAVMAEEAATVAVEAGTAKDALQVAVLAANATLEAAAALRLKSTDATCSIALAAGSAASRAGEKSFESIDAMAAAAVQAVQKVTANWWTPQIITEASTLAAALAVATSAIDTGKTRAKVLKTAVLYARKVGLQAQLGRLDLARAVARAAALSFSEAEPSFYGERLLTEAQKVAQEAAADTGATAVAEDLGRSAAQEADELKIPPAARQAAGLAAKHAGGQMSRAKAVKEISIVAQLAGRAAQLAGMTPEEVAVVMGLEIAEALPRFDAHDSPEPMAEDATMAALQAAKTLGLTLKQLEAVTMHAAAGGAITAGKIFFLNVQEISKLAVHAVVAASKGLADEDRAALAAKAAGCAAAQAVADAGASQERVQRAAAAAAQRAAASLQLTPAVASRLAALSAGRAAGRASASEGGSTEELRRSAADAAVAVARALQLPSPDLVGAEAAQQAASEAAAYTARGKKKQPPLPEPKKDFRSLDADGDGLVTAGELGKWEPENDFVSMERNGDGEITMQEFQKWNPQHAKVLVTKTKTAGALLSVARKPESFALDLLDSEHDQKSPEEENMERQLDTFSMLDLNHDGKLSADELRAWQGGAALSLPIRRPTLV
ncbi:unnamed protein product [Durusdinium trenchii]|uniref:EF-hand domain-containing protein n=1 Tax=Durusdinium trenchii TaxID=1381693 RepID=A0ABP0NIY0_9DINO